MTPSCPYPPGAAEAANWWEVYFRTRAIPAAVARMDAAAARRKALRAAKHFHFWDKANRRCFNCGMSEDDYQNDNFSFADLPTCPGRK